MTSEEIINNVTKLLPRLHVIVVGPGLSRDKMMLESAKGIIAKAKEKDLPLVIDAVCNHINYVVLHYLLCLLHYYFFRMVYISFKITQKLLRVILKQS